MRRAFWSEWGKLRRRGMAYAAAMVSFAVALAVGLGVGTAANGTTPQIGPGSQGLDIAAIISSDGFARELAGSATLVGVIMLSIFAFAFASEFSLGTLRNLLVRQPRRLRLMTGKLLALSMFSAAALVVAMVFALAVGLAAAQARGLDTSAWFTGVGLRETLAAGGRLLLAALGWGVLGALLGLVLRSPAAAIAVGVAYALPLENLLIAAWRSGANWLPGQLLQAIAEGGTDSVPFARAVLLFATYATLGLAAAAVALTRQDVTV